MLLPPDPIPRGYHYDEEATTKRRPGRRRQRGRPRASVVLLVGILQQLHGVDVFVPGGPVTVEAWISPGAVRVHSSRRRRLRLPLDIQKQWMQQDTFYQERGEDEEKKEEEAVEAREQPQPQPQQPNKTQPQSPKSSSTPTSRTAGYIHKPYRMGRGGSTPYGGGLVQPIHLETSMKESRYDLLTPTMLIQPTEYQDDGLDADSNDQQGADELLELLGPMTISDPLFAINSTNLNDGKYSETRNSSTINNNSELQISQPHLPPTLLEPHEFFANRPVHIQENGTMAYENDLNNNTMTSMNNNNNIITGDENTTTTKTMDRISTTHQQQQHDDLMSSYAPFVLWENATKQQLDAAQKAWLDYSTNATKELDAAWKKAWEVAVPKPSYSLGKPRIRRIKLGTDGTVDEDALDAYLRERGYVRQTELENADDEDGQDEYDEVLMGKRRARSKSSPQVQPRSSNAKILGNGTKSTTTITSAGSRGRVAFPQASVLSYRNLKWGSTVAASALGFVAGITIFPNLWLFGSLVGALYGYETTKHLPERPPSNALANLIVAMGRELTTTYLKVYDIGAGFWFMYKTGQLSYEYWQQYASLDEKFQIQSKIDAWNARFQQGKVNFDRWEQEHEVGRKILAGLRTVWLVEEQSLKNMSAKQKKSRYRLVQWWYDAMRYVRKRIKALWSKRGPVADDAKEFLQGMRQEVLSPSQWKDSLRPRVAAALAALVFVNLTGALFAVSPQLLGWMAVILGGVVWPTWFPEWLHRFEQFVEETKARGRGGEELEQFLRDKVAGSGKRRAIRSSLPVVKKNSQTFGSKTISGSGSSSGFRPSWPFRDQKQKEQYHFFVRSDGSKRWYRTGNAQNVWNPEELFAGLFGKNKQEEKPWWALH